MNGVKLIMKKMNNYTEALKDLSRNLSKPSESKSYMAIKELVERATPKKPKEQLIDNYCKGIPGETPNEKELNYFCPNCNELVGDEWSKYNYCPCCGQAIDWS